MDIFLGKSTISDCHSIYIEYKTAIEKLGSLEDLWSAYKVLLGYRALMRRYTTAAPGDDAKDIKKKMIALFVSAFGDYRDEDPQVKSKEGQGQIFVAHTKPMIKTFVPKKLGPHEDGEATLYGIAEMEGGGGIIYNEVIKTLVLNRHPTSMIISQESGTVLTLESYLKTAFVCQKLEESRNRGEQCAVISDKVIALWMGELDELKVKVEEEVKSFTL